MRDMTKEENKVLAASVEMFVRFRELPIVHMHDMREFVNHIHALQNIVLSRPATETNRVPDDFLMRLET